MNPAAILTSEHVMQIRAMKSAGHGWREMSARFGVCRATVYKVLSGKTWGHVHGEGAK